ncbi:HAD family hydrolase [Levilactobacillus lindianensis]|uniref:HAD family hydrolase n=1 Tax=Levilactobacillus lindianensis TaxID=2486018 RepID=UPI000F74475B|nr:HAD family hydrolase [Levilactobacillus lindianensis]
MIKAVVFDVDDTLYDQKAPFEAALAPILGLPSEVDLNTTFQAYRQQSRQAYAHVMNGHWSEQEMAVKRLNTALLAQHLPAVDTQSALNFEEAYSTGLADIKLFPGLSMALDSLSQQYQLGILTNGNTQFQLAKVMQLQMHRWIDREAIVTSEEVGLAKPDPQIFTLMNRRLNLRASEVAYVGDCYSMDVRAAKQAGWQSFWFNHRDLEEPDGQWVPDQTVTDPFELQDLLLALTTIPEA